MRKWIKEHPWRLEIVPFLYVLSAMVLPLHYHLLAGLGRLPDQAWADYTSDLLLIVIYWIGSVLLNHQWVRLEEKKDFNWRSILWTVGIAALASSGVRATSSGVVACWWLFAICGLAAQILLEHTRPFADFQARHSINLSDEAEAVQPGEPFYYREEGRGRWREIALALLMTAVTATFIAGQDESWWSVRIPLLCLFLIFALASRTRFIVSNHFIFAQVQWRRRRFAMPEVRECDVMNYNPLEFDNYSEIERYIPVGKYGLCLRLRTKRGIYLLGLEKPETACKLIQTALAARKQEQSTDFSHLP